MSHPSLNILRTSKPARATGVAARVGRGDALIVVEVEKDGVEVAKDALKRVADKFPFPSRVFVRE